MVELERPAESPSQSVRDRTTRTEQRDSCAMRSLRLPRARIPRRPRLPTTIRSAVSDATLRMSSARASCSSHPGAIRPAASRSTRASLLATMARTLASKSRAKCRCSLDRPDRVGRAVDTDHDPSRPPFGVDRASCDQDRARPHAGDTSTLPQSDAGGAREAVTSADHAVASFLSISARRLCSGSPSSSFVSRGWRGSASARPRSSAPCLLCELLEHLGHVPARMHGDRGRRTKAEIAAPRGGSGGKSPPPGSSTPRGSVGSRPRPGSGIHPMAGEPAM